VRASSAKSRVRAGLEHLVIFCTFCRKSLFRLANVRSPTVGKHHGLFEWPLRWCNSTRVPHLELFFKISCNPHLNANHEQCSNAASMRPCSPRLTELTSMNRRVLVIEKHPPVCWESFCGHPLEAITTDGPPKIGPILKSIRKKMCILRPFFCRA
jgi:hypothetical protein